MNKNSSKKSKKTTSSKKRSKKQNKKLNFRKVCITIILCLTLLVSGFITLNENELKIQGVPTWIEIYNFFSTDGKNSRVDFGDFNTSDLLENEVVVYFFDIGQGDSELIITKDETILIDTGESENYPQLYNNLLQLGIDKLDYAIISHPHSDHAGSMSNVIDDFKPYALIMPDIKDEIVPTTKFFNNILTSLENSDTKLITVSPNGLYSDIILLNGEAKIEFLAPLEYYNDLNNSSIVLKLTHGENSFLFTGDIEKKAENDILDKYGSEIKSDILKVAHHGSESSSTEKFLKAVGGSIAVIEVGKGNTYNHPRQQTLDNLEKNNYKILRTDDSGNIIFYSDSNSLKYKTEK